jgi:hypothetical protein
MLILNGELFFDRIFFQPMAKRLSTDTAGSQVTKNLRNGDTLAPEELTVFTGKVSN